MDLTAPARQWLSPTRDPESPVKIHAVVDADGLPVRLGLTPGEAHDNRLCTVLLM